MKLFALPLMVLTLAGSAVVAQPPERRVVVQRTVIHKTSYHAKRRVCTTRWVNHHRVRRCAWR